MKVIEFQGISKNFGALPVLKKLSLDIFQGDRIALVGQNGSGKTTLIRCLLGFYNFEGSVKVFGLSQRKDREQILHKIAFVPQYAPPLKSTVGEMCAQVQSYFEVAPSEFEKYSDRLDFDLAKLREQLFRKLSGGMKRKLLIILALVRKPKFLVMDEPAAGLDALSRAKFYTLLEELPKETVVLMSSHRVDEISNLVNRVVELDGGQVVLDDIMSTHLSRDVEFCLSLVDVPDVVEKGLLSWGFKKLSSDGKLCVWQGLVPAADKFRFVGTLTRWSGLIVDIEMHESREGNSL